MKKLLFILGVSIVTFSVSQAQSKNDLKGPKAKNYKIWQDDSQPVTVITVASKEQLRGPAAKNRKPWTVSATEKNKVAIVRNTRRSQLKGPAAKNYKPWND